MAAISPSIRSSGCYATTGSRGWVYSSARNRAEEPRWRLAIPFTEQVNATQDVPRTIYRALAGIIENELGADKVWKIDTTKFAPSSIFYVPGIYTTATSDDGVQFEPHNEFVHVQGDILPYERWEALADELSPRPLPPPLPTRPDSGYLDKCTYEDMESAVNAADNDLDYLSWKKVAAAIYDGGGDLSVFDRFSRKWPNYDRRGTEKAWMEIVRCPMTHVTVGTLFDLAKQSDPSWVSPSRQWKREQSPEGKHQSPRSSDTSKSWWEREFDIDLEEAVPFDQPADEQMSDEAARPCGRLKWFSDYLDEPPIEYWDADRLLPKIEEGITILILGRRGSHKTGVMSQIVLDAIFNDGLKATYVPCEDQQFYRQQRVPAYCAARGITVRDLDDRYAVYEDGINLTNKKAVDAFIRENQEFGPNIVIVDTLRQATPGIDMNSSAMADILAQDGPVRTIRKALNCIVIVLCHPPKNNPGTVSGSGGIEDNSDMIIECEYDHVGTITTTVTRCKNGPEGTRFYYKVDPSQVPVPTRFEQDDDRKPTGFAKHPDLDLDVLIRHHLALHIVGTKQVSLTNRQVAEAIVQMGETEEHRSTYNDRVRAMVRNLENIQQRKVGNKSVFDDICHCVERTTAKGGKKTEWRWWIEGDPRATTTLDMVRREGETTH